MLKRLLIFLFIGSSFQYFNSNEDSDASSDQRSESLESDISWDPEEEFYQNNIFFDENSEQEEEQEVIPFEHESNLFLEQPEYEQNVFSVNEPNLFINSDFEILTHKSYLVEEESVSVEALAKVNGTLYSVLVENGRIRFCALVNNQFNLLKELPINEQSQFSAGYAIVYNNTIYYEFFIKTGIAAARAQYFKLDLVTNNLIQLGEHRLVPEENHYLEKNNLSVRKHYFYKNYLVITHAAMWEKHSSATIINLSDDSFTIKNSCNSLFMTFADGYLFYDKLMAYNVVTEETLVYENRSNFIFSYLYSYDNQVFINLVDDFNVSWSISRILVVSNQIVLEHFCRTDNEIRAAYIYQDQLYFCALEKCYNLITQSFNITAKLFHFNNYQLEMIFYYNFDQEDVVSIILDQECFYLLGHNFYYQSVKFNLLTREKASTSIRMRAIQISNVNLSFASLVSNLYQDCKFYFGFVSPVRLAEEDCATGPTISLAEFSWRQN